MFSLSLPFLVASAFFAAPLVRQNPPPPPSSTAKAPSDTPVDQEPTDFSKGVDDSWHPAGEKEFKEAVGEKKIKFKQWNGLQLYCDDAKLFTALSKALDKAWPEGTKLLSGSPFPKGMHVRIVALKSAESLKAYWEIVKQGAKQLHTAPPPEALYSGLLKAGSTRWNLPPTVLLRPGRVSSSAAPTRAVHDLGVLMASWSCSYSGYGSPEFLAEGFAGMLERRSVKKPAAIVSHEKAALTETIHGYGVFATIGAAMNDSSNSPGNWPRIMQNAVKSMLKKRSSDDSEGVDSLLLRSHRQFARTDYAYAWATMEFLFDDSQMKEGKSLRQGLHQVLKDLKAPKNASMTQLRRSQEFRELLLAELHMTPTSLHQAFLDWVPKHLPKK